MRWERNQNQSRQPPALVLVFLGLWFAGKMEKISLERPNRKEAFHVNDYTCYHCEHQVSHVHPVTFYETDGERNELLCKECYAEWLESIKG